MCKLCSMAVVVVYTCLLECHANARMHLEREGGPGREGAGEEGSQGVREEERVSPGIKKADERKGGRYPAASAFIQLRTIAEHNITKAPATQISHAISLLDLHHRPSSAPHPSKWGLWQKGQRVSSVSRDAGVVRERQRAGGEMGGEEGAASRIKSVAWTKARTSAGDGRSRLDGWRRGTELGKPESGKTEYAICQATFWGLRF